VGLLLTHVSPDLIGLDGCGSVTGALIPQKGLPIRDRQGVPMALAGHEKW
jgi:hypothetical protein